MNTKELLEKINKRNKYVMNCGTARNNSYLKYQTSASRYDTLKKGFYTAKELSKLDGDVPEEELQGYAHSVKYFDKQILNQFKERNYQIHKILLDEIQNASFKDRITKIETEGLLRNQFHFELTDNKENYEKSKILFYKEISLGVKDGLIGDIEEKIYFGSMKEFEKKLEEELMQHRQDFLKMRLIKGFNGGCTERGGRSGGGSERGGRSGGYSERGGRSSGGSERGGRSGAVIQRGGRIGGNSKRYGRGCGYIYYDSRRYDGGVRDNYGPAYGNNGYGSGRDGNIMRREGRSRGTRINQRYNSVYNKTRPY